MPKKRMSADAKLVIEGAREDLEDKACQTLELIDKNESTSTENTSSNITAQSHGSGTQPTQAISSKDRDAGNLAVNSQSSADQSAGENSAGCAVQTGGVGPGAHETQRIAEPNRVGSRQPITEDGDDE